MSSSESPDEMSQVADLRGSGAEVYPGTGIGLAIVRRGVERMGGQVGVESALAQGSRFWIELPALRTKQSLDTAS